MLNWITSVDHVVQSYFVSTYSESAVVFWDFITFFASSKAIIAFAVIALIFFAYKKAWLRVLEVLVITIGTAGTVLILKFLINRIRPMGGFVAETGPSFPSWHAAGGMMFFGFIFFVLADQIRNRFARIGMHLLGVILIVLEPISRLELNVHYSSDVLAGLIIGAFWLLLGERIYIYLEKAEPMQFGSKKEA